MFCFKAKLVSIIIIIYGWQVYIYSFLRPLYNLSLLEQFGAEVSHRASTLCNVIYTVLHTGTPQRGIVSPGVVQQGFPGRADISIPFYNWEN